MTRVALILSIVVCACAGTTPVVQDPKKEKVYLAASPAAPPPEGTMLCMMERPTGSNIAQRVCRYRNQSDYNSQRTRELMEQMRYNNPCPDGNCASAPSGSR
jgi:hypothetical protein